MSRKEMVEAALWEGILAAWHDGDLHRARELDAHLSQIEEYSESVFEFVYPAVTTAV